MVNINTPDKKVDEMMSITHSIPFSQMESMEFYSRLNQQSRNLCREAKKFPLLPSGKEGFGENGETNMNFEDLESIIFHMHLTCMFENSGFEKSLNCALEKDLDEVMFTTHSTPFSQMESMGFYSRTNQQCRNLCQEAKKFPLLPSGKEGLGENGEIPCAYKPILSLYSKVTSLKRSKT